MSTIVLEDYYKIIYKITYKSKNWISAVLTISQSVFCYISNKADNYFT